MAKSQGAEEGRGKLYRRWVWHGRGVGATWNLGDQWLSGDERVGVSSESFVWNGLAEPDIRHRGMARMGGEEGAKEKRGKGVKLNLIDSVRLVSLGPFFRFLFSLFVPRLMGFSVFCSLFFFGYYIIPIDYE